MDSIKRAQKRKKQARSSAAYTESREYKRRVERHGRWSHGQHIRCTAGPDCRGELTDRGLRININEMNGRIIFDPDAV